MVDMRVTFEQAAAVITDSLEFGVQPAAKEQFLTYADEDQVGGYPEVWPMGSIWEVEGKVLYALVRILKPEVVLEFGTGSCCSAAHITKAMNRNRKGKLYSIDRAQNLTHLTVDGHKPSPRKAFKRCKYVIADGITWSQELDFSVQMIFEDTIHSRETTREIIKAALPHLDPGGVVVSHDSEHFLVGRDVTLGLHDALGDFLGVLIEPADCGLGLWRKPSQSPMIL